MICASLNSLSIAQTEALARLLCLLESGEGAAALSFSALAKDHPAVGAEAALAEIATEEQLHGTWVNAMASWLPVAAGVRPAILAARRLHVAIGRGSVAERLAGVAALDSAVCILFSRLLQARAPLASSGEIATILRRIHRDEARHVTIASHFALGCDAPAVLRQRAALIRDEFANVLALVAADFDSLAVDPDRLLRSVRALPTGLLAG